MFTRIGCCTLLAACVAVAGCDEALSDLTGPTPQLEPTLSSIQREIFNTTDPSGRTACTNCHSGALPAAGLNLSDGASHASLVNVTARTKPTAIRVIPGDAENSYLVHKLEGQPGIVGLRMPRNNGPFLTEGQMLVIKRWIALGARND